MSLRIIIDKPSGGGDKGHLCIRCKHSDHITGPGGFEKYTCGAGHKVIQEITQCTNYLDKEVHYQAPKDILNLALFAVKYMNGYVWLTSDQEEDYNYADHEDREDMLRKWGKIS